MATNHHQQDQNSAHLNFVNDLNAISNKCEVYNLNMSNSPIVELKKYVLVEFRNVVDLNLSNCFINEFENKVFEHLFSLQAINLSYNVIGTFNSNLFATNTNLKVINLQNNYLESINKSAFSMLINLESLNLSYNFITVVPGLCLNCPNLKQLYLNNNAIVEVVMIAFHYVTNLTHLELNDNKILRLHEDTFLFTKKLQHLNLNNNKLDKIDQYTFNELIELKKLSIRNNCLTHFISNFIFLCNINLLELDLSDNLIDSVSVDAFNSCQNLEILKLTIQNKFKMKSLRYLDRLEEFVLVYKGEMKFYGLTKAFWASFDHMSNIVVIKVIMQNVAHRRTLKFAGLHHLEYLHIECLEPNNQLTNFDFMKQFDNMRMLKKIVLKRLNFFTVSGQNLYTDFVTKNLTEIDFTGVKNYSVSYFFLNFRYLEALNLSFSEIESIYENAFRNSVNLKHLNLEHSKLKLITSQLFLYTTKLEIINCANCHLETIEDFAFLTLDSLKTLDLTNNCLTNTNEFTFFGLDDNVSILTSDS